MRAQRWIAQRILTRGRPHWASYAYAPGSNIRLAADLHCGYKWLIKLDVRRFFESISELAVYRVIVSLGYRPLIAFEMARICTRTLSVMCYGQWRSTPGRYSAIASYQHNLLGHLPQGAPTSPMLSNLAMFAFDERGAAIAKCHGLVYTRYADDIALSTSSLTFTRDRAAAVVGEVYKAMSGFGLSPNRTKTKIAPPGARKVILGLLVDGCRPKLSREFKSNLRQHIHYLLHPDIGPIRHAARRHFSSTHGLKNHVCGLVRFARSIEPDFAASCIRQLSGVVWPP